jgi:hypothetical protein
VEVWLVISLACRSPLAGRVQLQEKMVAFTWASL